MRKTYLDLIQQTYDFPQEGFEIRNNALRYHGLDLMALVEQFGSPMKVSDQRVISMQIEKARHWFRTAMQEQGYNAEYKFCYCTKSSHFNFVLEEVLRMKAHIETSSEFDLHIIQSLIDRGLVDKHTHIHCNGHKPEAYIKGIARLINNGYKVTPVLDSPEELTQLVDLLSTKASIGIRIATEERPGFEFYTSRLGIRYSRITDFYESLVTTQNKVEVTMLHFFINNGISDTTYYWAELNKCMQVYTRLAKICPTLNSLNIGGGFPFRSSLNFDYDYAYMADEIIRQIKEFCTREQVQEPHIFTEFGSFTTAESAFNIYTVLDVKHQNDAELWYMINNSFMNTIPDAWSMNQRFILLPLNHWDQPYHRVNLGGLSCDSMDYYNSESHGRQVYLPIIPEGETLHIGMFHTGAYQDALSGYGGIKHCLIPSPQHLLVRKGDGKTPEVSPFRPAQSASEMLEILGY